MKPARGPKCRSLIVAGLAVCSAAFAAPGSALGAPAAAEEYVLTLPGVDKTTAGGSTIAPDAPASAEGVTGERDDPGTPLAALGSSMLSLPGLAIVAPALALLAAAAIRGRGRFAHRAG